MVTATATEGELAYTSVLTTIRILETKGYVSHRQDGRAFLFSSSVGEVEAGRSEVRQVLSRFFGNSRERLLLSLLGDEEIGAAELERLKAAIAQAPDDEVRLSKAADPRDTKGSIRGRAMRGKA